jgi:uncharacterized protein with GYD domain
VVHTREVGEMPMYVGLYRITAQDAANVKEAPERIREAIAAWEAMGGKVTVVLATMGRYDYISVGEAPSDEAAATFAAGMALRGDVTAETLRAFTPEEFAAMLAKLH